MNLEDRFKLITRNAEEIIQPDEIRQLLEEKEKINAYAGFEISGYLHLGTGFIVGRKLKDFAEAGIHTIVFLADWHSYINDKLGGDMEAIRAAGEYFEHAMRAVGLDMPNVEYVYSHEIADSIEYWEKVIRIAKHATLTRIIRCLPIMGRKETEEMNSSWLFYPPMQAADIKQMEIDIALGGTDQRKIHVLTREIFPKLKWKKPVIIHTPLLMGLSGAGGRMDLTQEELQELKMSKSKPMSAIFIHDSPKTVQKKIRKALCPPKEVQNNPVAEIVRLIIFPNFGKFEVSRPEKYGGDVVYNTWEEFVKDYEEGNLSPVDLKNGVTDGLNKLLEPVHKYFEKRSDLLELMKKITGVPVE